MTPQSIGTVEDIVEKLSEFFLDFSRSTYYRRKNEGINQLGNLLWGYTTKKCDPVLDLFDFEETNKERGVFHEYIRSESKENKKK